MAQTKAQLLGPVVGDVVMDVSTLSLDAEGNKVGIGHSEPDLTLHVSGVNGLPSSSGSTPTGHLTIRNKAGSTHGMFIGVSDASPWSSWIQAQDASNNATNYPLLLNPNGGNVGIGTDNPQGKLVVSDGANGLEFNPNSNNAIVSYNRTTSAYAPNGLQGSTVQLRIGGVGTALHVHSNSNVGIGTETPGALLHLESTAANAARLRIGFDSPRYYDIFRGSTTNSGYLNFYGSQSSFTGYIFDGVDGERLRITSDGTILAGGQTASYDGGFVNLELRKDSTTVGGSMTLVNDQSATAGATCQIDCYQNYRSAGKIVFGRENANNWQAAAGGAASFLSFHTNNAGTESEKLRIDSSGRITANGVSVNNAWGGGDDLVLGGTGSGTRTGITLVSGSDTDGGIYWSHGTGNNAYAGQIAYNHASDMMSFYTNSTAQLRITSAGLVGIGQVSPQGDLHIGNISGSKDLIMHSANNGNARVRFREGGSNTSGFNEYSIGMVGNRNAITIDGQGAGEILTIKGDTGFIGIKNTNPSRALSIGYNDSTAYSASGYCPSAGAIRIFNEATAANSSAGEILLGAGASGTGWAAISCRRPGSQETELNFRVMDSATWNTGITINKLAYVGIGVDSPAVKLDVKKATAGTIARFYDNGSNGGALYNGGPILGLSRVSNGSVSLDGLLFQVGIDTTNSDSYNINETVFAVGNKGVGIGEDDPQVMLHCSKALGSTASYKDAQMIRIAGTNGANTMAGIGFGYHTTNPSASAYPSAWIGAKVSSWTQYVKHDLVFATRDTDANTEPEERFRITESGELIQNNNSQYTQKGWFDTKRSSQNANNNPAMAAGLSYGFGYQEAYSTSSGGWSHPYPDLVIGYHTGVSFGGNTSYQGCRFFADHPSLTSTLLFSVGNGNNSVVVTNSLSKGGGTFRIAHPHPSKKYTHDLQHSFIEGPQCDNLYRGRVDLVDGTASINIDTASNMTDGTFVLLNRDIQCFTSNETGWDPVKGSVSGNILTITSQNNSSTDTISWMVIGERQDDKIKSTDMDMTDSDGKLIVEPLTIEQSHM